MSSYVGFGQNMQYVLPFQTEAVPSSMKSSQAPRPINCTISTVSVPATSGNANAGGLTTVQIPLGNAAYMANPYLRFKLTVTTGGNSARYFKGAARAATSAISSYQTSINSTLIDNVLNYGQVSDSLFCHACSSNYLTKDGSVLFNALTQTANGVNDEVYAVPLLGLLSSQSAMPLWLIQGTLSITINWASLGAMFAGTAAADSILTAVFSDVALVYDRITVEGDFIAKMKSDMMSSGAKYVYNYTAYQSLSAVSTNGQNTINTGLNVSSLRAVTLTSPVTADLTAQTATGYSIRNGLSQFQVSLDGRLISNAPIDAVAAPAAAFAELNKCYSRLFDSAVDDLSTKSTYLTDSFAAGVNCCRVAEGLSFQGSPCSVVSVALTQNAATATNFITFISDQSLLIGADGAVDLVR
jgi:hypothetical protein